MRPLISTGATRWLIFLLVIALLALSFVVRPPLAHIQLPGEHLFDLFGVPITNSTFTAYLVSIILIVVSFLATRRLPLVPVGRFQTFIEAVVELLLNLVEGVAGRQRGRQFFPLVATIFLFILTANWMGLLPGFATVGLMVEHHGELMLVPFLRSANSDLNTTIGLAIVSVVAIQYFGIRYTGLRAYIGKFISFSSPIAFIMGLLELIGEVSRVVSLSFRLFGNIFAGEVLLLVMSFLVPFVAVLPFYGLEIFVGAIQAFIFAMLTLVFATLASLEHGGESHESQGSH
jgi:F-type H+-transporting ATPase subunit a